MNCVRIGWWLKFSFSKIYIHILLQQQSHVFHPNTQPNRIPTIIPWQQSIQTTSKIYVSVSVCSSIVLFFCACMCVWVVITFSCVRSCAKHQCTFDCLRECTVTRTKYRILPKPKDGGVCIVYDKSGVFLCVFLVFAKHLINSVKINIHKILFMSP